MVLAISKEWSQPIRLFVGTKNFLVLLLKLPWWLLSSALPPLRPRPSWSFRKTIMVRLLQPILDVNKTVVRYQPAPNHKAIEGKMGVWIEPSPKVIVGNVDKWAQNARVKPARIPGYWIHKKGSNFSIGEKPSAQEKVAYYIHGGGFMTLSAHPDSIVCSLPKGMLKSCPTVTRSFAVEYRLTTGPPLNEQGTFPAALMDAIAGYNYLVNTVGFTPSQIIVLGDSAGGNLALGLARYLVENAAALPTLAPPGGLFLLSPWADLVSEDYSAESSLAKNGDHDIILPPSTCALGWAVRCYAGPLGNEGLKKNAYLSPASSHVTSSAFKGLPKTFIAVGDAEVLLDGVRKLRGMMKEALGDKVTYFEAKDSIHDFMIFDWEEPQRSHAFKALADWVKSL